MKDDKFYLINILECIDKIESYTKDGKNAFMSDTLIQDAVIRKFEIMGEATKRLSIDLRKKYTNIPWKNIAGLRDVLIHDYLDVDIDQVWNIIELNLNEFKSNLKEIIDFI
jgi:uncharacterized protein with HEPN domain